MDIRGIAIKNEYISELNKDEDFFDLDLRIQEIKIKAMDMGPTKIVTASGCSCECSGRCPR